MTALYYIIYYWIFKLMSLMSIFYRLIGVIQGQTFVLRTKRLFTVYIPMHATLNIRLKTKGFSKTIGVILTIRLVLYFN